MRAKGVFRNLRRGNYAKVVAALTPGSHQLVDWTAPNRYPEIFAAAAAAAPDARRILSFGCSTGEECVSLAEYFPKAEITGAEINVLSLVKAWKKRSDRIRFVYSSDRTLTRLAPFDVVFCMLTNRIGIFVSLPFDKLSKLSLQKHLDEIGQSQPVAAKQSA